jgi:hypothetical protein
MKVDNRLLNKLLAHHLSLEQFKRILIRQNESCIICDREFRDSSDVFIMNGYLYCGKCCYKKNES